MARRRRDIPPPFEVMGSSDLLRAKRKGDSGQGQTDGLTNQAQDQSDNRTRVTDFLSDAWSGSSRRPIVFRVPKGHAVLLVAGIVGLIVLTYLVGLTRGRKAGIAEQQQRQEQIAQQLAVAGGHLGQQLETTASKDPDDVGVEKTTNGEWRKAGYNYYIIARYPEDDARRLVRFLRSNALETKIVPVNNEGLCHVVGVRRFHRSELRSEQSKEYKREIIRLGRIWRTRHRGTGDLSDHYAKRYDGP